MAYQRSKISCATRSQSPRPATAHIAGASAQAPDQTRARQTIAMLIPTAGTAHAQRAVSEPAGSEEARLGEAEAMPSGCG